MHSGDFTRGVSLSKVLPTCLAALILAACRVPLSDRRLEIQIAPVP
jgi:hypothetical protein